MTSATTHQVPFSVEFALVSFADATIARLPRPVRPFAERHHELIKFAIVGATTFVTDSVISFTLKLSIPPSIRITSLTSTSSMNAS